MSGGTFSSQPNSFEKICDEMRLILEDFWWWDGNSMLPQRTVTEWISEGSSFIFTLQISRDWWRLPKRSSRALWLSAEGDQASRGVGVRRCRVKPPLAGLSTRASWWRSARWFLLLETPLCLRMFQFLLAASPTFISLSCWACEESIPFTGMYTVAVIIIVV